MQQTEDFETEVSIELGDQDKPCVALNLQIRKGNVHQREDLAVEVISEFANKERQYTQLKETFRSVCLYLQIGEGHAHQWKHFAVTVSYDCLDFDRRYAGKDIYLNSQLWKY